MRPEKDSPLAKLQEQFIRLRLRIINMAEVDVGVFEMDYTTTFGLFILNHRKQVYLRYGARDDAGPESHLSLPSVQVALQRGLKWHKAWKAGDLKLPPAGPSRLAQSYPNVRKVVQQNQCVHCHQVAEGQAEALFAREDFVKLTSSWIFPDPTRLGFELEPDDPTILAAATGAAAAAGMTKGEQIQKVEDRLVGTFADLQLALHHHPHHRKTLTLTTNRGRRTLTLPPHWRVTDLNRRAIGHKMEPFPGFWGQPLSDDEKSALGLPLKSFATRATRFWTNTPGKLAGLQEGDIITAVDGVSTSPFAVNAQIYIRLHYEAGDEITVTYRRDGTLRQARYTLKARPW